MNKIILIGNLTKDPVMRSTNSGKTVCSFTVAVDRKVAGQDGKKITDFFTVNAWGKMGESCGKYLSKGKKAAVVGEMQARTYQGKDGKTYLSLDVFAEEVEFLTPKQQANADPFKEPVEQDGPSDWGELTPDDIPF